MHLRIDEKALKDLAKIDQKQAFRIFEKIESLQNFPELSNIKRLTNFTPGYRYRIGDYRVLFDIENDTLTVYRVLHRRESYK